MAHPPRTPFHTSGMLKPGFVLISPPGAPFMCGFIAHGWNSRVPHVSILRLRTALISPITKLCHPELTQLPKRCHPERKGPRAFFSSGVVSRRTCFCSWSYSCSCICIPKQVALPYLQSPCKTKHTSRTWLRAEAVRFTSE